MSKRNRTLMDRVLDGLQSPRPIDGSCWEWQGSVSRLYGRIHIWGKPTIQAHRAAYEAFVGPIPDGMVVRHSCDNPPCCNPDHLSIGTRKDNTGDMLERGRDCHGAEHPFAKLTESKVREFRVRHSQGVGISALAREIGVHPQTVRSAVLRKTWRHVA